jgi:alpha-glucosidase
MVASVVEPGATTRRLRMPAGAAWIDFWTGERHGGGELVELPAPWGRPPLLAREGSAIALNIAPQSFDRRADTRAFAVFAATSGAFETTCHEDDGESEAWRRGEVGQWRLGVRATPDRLEARCQAEGRRPPRGPVALLLRPAETRPVFVGDRQTVETRFEDWRRIELAP